MSCAIEFDFQPTLIGPRLTVRPIKVSDWQGMFTAASDPQIWVQHPASDRYQEAVFRNYFDGALASGSGFAFVDNSSGQIVGSSRYHGYDPAVHEVEIGWTFLTRPYWGGSYNAEVKHLMLEHAFRFVDTVVFWVGASNWRSRRAMLKIGGVLRAGDWLRSHGATSEPYAVYEIRKDFPSWLNWEHDH
ncbi:MAG: GNAT family N-acetyltransferase [Gammaproteobacteria bacterium]|nr:GNAT family N-acetyltransferase [Gammaproteobacteria bacterium]MDH5304993.1 GNAT family N-acetyltransferase [Gammaproteobacteria bacterium]MDH5321995.1 GNAT family N-acetyltransferase [Gammaproteobacteria bacterium]